jgi:hypothetical protein
MRAWLVQLVLPLGTAALLLSGFLLLGRLAAAGLGEGRFFAFAEVECGSPPGVGREAFLREVQYEADLPDRVSLLEPDLPRRLERAFAGHVWVEAVERVELGRGRLTVALCFRTPALTVESAGEVRVADRAGTLLPRATSVAGLPAFRGERLPDAAQTAGFLADVRCRLALESVETTADGVVLWTKTRSRIVWGRPPGSEQPDEATAGLKRDRLLEFLRRQGDEGATLAYEHDLRPSEAARHRPLKDAVVRKGEGR